MTKSADAFRTISEVADWLGVQPHVLRFWESKFAQVKPVKRAGGRRYYRPVDMRLLGGIRKLLHDDGVTIKGVQKIIREEGVAHVADLSPPLEEDIIPLDNAAAVSAAPPGAPEPEQQEVFAEPPREPPEPVAASADAPMETDAEPPDATISPLPSFLSKRADTPEEEPNEVEEPLEPGEAESAENDAVMEADTPTPPEDQQPEPAASLPRFLTEPQQPPDSAPEPPATSGPKPRVVEAPDPDETALTAAPGALSTALTRTGLTKAQRQSLAPAIARLAAHRDKLALPATQTGSP